MSNFYRDVVDEDTEERWPSAAERVKDGIDWLDAVEVDWQFNVNPDTLDIESAYSCVIGQIDGEYSSAFFYARGVAWPTQFAREHGFMPVSDDDGPVLTFIWREALIAMRG